jgi:hypothetical protein
MSALTVSTPERSIAGVTPETRERIRQLITTIDGNDDCNESIETELATLMRGEDLWVSRSAVAVFYDGTLYLAICYEEIIQLWIIDPSMIRSMTTPSPALHMIASAYLESAADSETPFGDNVDREMGILARTLRAAICAYLGHPACKKGGRQVVINIGGLVYLANHRRVIASFNPASILYL